MLEQDIFGAHYDEGRITRCADRDPVYAHLAQASIKRYRQLEEASGTEFYTEVGNLMVGGRGTEFISQIQSNINADKIACEQMQGNDLQTNFPFIRLPEDDIVLYEKTNAGYISPRKMIFAQLSVASNNGCDIIRDIVRTVTKTATATGTYVMRITTETGAEYTAKRVLLRHLEIY